VPRQGITSVTQPPAKINKLYLRVPDMDCHIFRKVDNLVDIFDGWIPVIYYNNSTQQYVTSSKKVTLTPVCYAELISLLGKENVVPK
jgi:DNA polymerase-3 subunit alpha